MSQNEGINGSALSRLKPTVLHTMSHQKSESMKIDNLPISELLSKDD